MSTSVSKSGPLFDGRARMMINEATRDMEHHLASVGADMVRGELERVLRKETPYYRLQVTSKEYPGSTVITDQGVVYGNWLEGTGSRNRTTRFKGYATFRRMAYMIQARGESILAPYVDRLIERLNHGS